MRINIASPDIGEEEIRGVTDVLRSGVLASGPRVVELEQAFARFVGTAHAVATNSGTAALMVALQALGIGPGDEVITSPFTFIASANAILYTGAKPVFVGRAGGRLQPGPRPTGSPRSHPRTKAVLPIHLYGQTAEMEPIANFCQTHNLHLVEDACQAHGATYRGKKAGSFGVGTFSFYPTKNMTTSEGA